MESAKQSKPSSDIALALKEKGNQHMVKQQYEEAMECYTEAMKMDHKIKERYTNRALAYLNIAQNPKVIDDCEHAIKLIYQEDKGAQKYSNLLCKAYYRSGSAHQNLGNHQEAYKLAMQALEINPNDPQAMKLKYDSKHAAPHDNSEQEQNSLYFPQRSKRSDKFISEAIVWLDMFMDLDYVKIKEGEIETLIAGLQEHQNLKKLAHEKRLIKKLVKVLMKKPQLLWNISQAFRELITNNIEFQNELYREKAFETIFEALEKLFKNDEAQKSLDKITFEIIMLLGLCHLQQKEIFTIKISKIFVNFLKLIYPKYIKKYQDTQSGCSIILSLLLMAYDVQCKEDQISNYFVEYGMELFARDCVEILTFDREKFDWNIPILDEIDKTKKYKELTNKQKKDINNQITLSVYNLLGALFANEKIRKYFNSEVPNVQKILTLSLDYLNNVSISKITNKDKWTLEFIGTYLHVFKHRNFTQSSYKPLDKIGLFNTIKKFAMIQSHDETIMAIVNDAIETISTIGYNKEVAKDQKFIEILFGTWLPHDDVDIAYNTQTTINRWFRIDSPYMKDEDFSKEQIEQLCENYVESFMKHLKTFKKLVVIKVCGIKGIVLRYPKHCKKLRELVTDLLLLKKLSTEDFVVYDQNAQCDEGKKRSFKVVAQEMIDLLNSDIMNVK